MSVSTDNQSEQDKHQLHPLLVQSPGETRTHIVQDSWVHAILINMMLFSVQKLRIKILLRVRQTEPGT